MSQKNDLWKKSKKRHKGTFITFELFYKETWLKELQKTFILFLNTQTFIYLFKNEPKTYFFFLLWVGTTTTTTIIGAGGVANTFMFMDEEVGKC